MEVSIVRIKSRAQFINWLNSLPVRIDLVLFNEIVYTSEGMKYAMWEKKLGFSFF